MYSLCSKTVKNLQIGLFFIDAAVMLALEPLGMTIYILPHSYSSVAFQSNVKKIKLNYFPKAYVSHILASRNTYGDYMARTNIIQSFS